jgi:RNA polymerase sigma-70 factor (ECF subfamily)
MYNARTLRGSTMADDSVGGDRPHSPSVSTHDTGELLRAARAGRRSALDVLFGRQSVSLRRWARGRLPAWARRAVDTADLVQETLVKVFGRVDKFEAQRRGALGAYLRQAIHNRIRDEIRTVGRRPTADIDQLPLQSAEDSPLQELLSAEDTRRYRRALDRLKPGDRELIVGAVELGYNHAQLAAATGRTGADAARVALHRALKRLATEMARE